MHPAMAARLNKDASPERYCPALRCLWNTARSGPCPKHQGGPHILPWPEPRPELEPKPDPEPKLKICDFCDLRPAAHAIQFEHYGPRKADACCFCSNCESERCIPFELDAGDCQPGVV